MSLETALARLGSTGFDARPGVVNSHIHLPPNFSSFRSVDEAVAAARDAGCVLLGASNYYDYAVYGPFVNSCLESGIVPLLGVEVVCWDQGLADRGQRANDPANPGKVYLCGKATTRLAPMTNRASAILNRIRNGDRERVRAMAERLWPVLGMPRAEAWDAVVRQMLGPDPSPESLESAVPQERHLAQAAYVALSAGGSDAVSRVLGQPEFDASEPTVVQDAIRSRFLKVGKPAYVEEAYVSFEEAVEFVQELGGVVSYPVVADGASPRGDWEADPETLVRVLRERNIGWAEFIPNRNSPEVLTEFVESLTRSGIRCTAGTEHNTPDGPPVAPRCRGGEPVPEACRKVFEESAWELAARQARALSGGHP
ncbi:MAG: hypothetical protein SNJ74_03960 [Fimbriimonadaceae bacterium]